MVGCVSVLDLYSYRSDAPGISFVAQCSCNNTRVGYVCGVKSTEDAPTGDTFVRTGSGASPLPGFAPALPTVFASLPVTRFLQNTCVALWDTLHS